MIANEKTSTLFVYPPPTPLLLKLACSSMPDKLDCVDCVLPVDETSGMSKHSGAMYRAVPVCIVISLLDAAKTGRANLLLMDRLIRVERRARRSLLGVA